MTSRRRERRIFLTAAIFAVTIIFSITISAEARTATPPPYRPSGVIPGTSLLYERLVISNNGGVKITIVNPTNNGVAFNARFAFFNNKDAYLTGFIIDDFATANGKKDYSLRLDNHRAYRNAIMMRVLGRAGRMGRDPAPDNDDK